MLLSDKACASRFVPCLLPTLATTMSWGQRLEQGQVRRAAAHAMEVEARERGITLEEVRREQCEAMVRARMAGSQPRRRSISDGSLPTVLDRLGMKLEALREGYTGTMFDEAASGASVWNDRQDADRDRLKRLARVSPPSGGRGDSSSESTKSPPPLLGSGLAGAFRSAPILPGQHVVEDEDFSSSPSESRSASPSPPPVRKAVSDSTVAGSITLGGLDPMGPWAEEVILYDYVVSIEWRGHMFVVRVHQTPDVIYVSPQLMEHGLVRKQLRHSMTKKHAVLFRCQGHELVEITTAVES